MSPTRPRPIFPTPSPRRGSICTTRRSPGNSRKKCAGSAPCTAWPAAIAAARFLAFTGWRSGEALSLRWDAVDLARRTATLTGNLVFPATRGDGLMSGFRKLWDKITALGALPADVTPHVLRHSFASLAGDVGYSDITIASLIGHANATMTSKYIHMADPVLLAAADAVANRTAELMGEPRSTGVVVELRKANA